MTQIAQVTEEQIKARETKFWQEYYGAFEGATIVKFLGVIEDDPTANSGFPTFQIKFRDGSIGQMQVSQDPEGNGGGFLFGGNMTWDVGNEN